MPSSDSNAGVMSAPLINIVVNNVLLHFGPQINRRAGNNRTTLVFSESDKPEQFALALETFFISKQHGHACLRITSKGGLSQRHQHQHLCRSYRDSRIPIVKQAYREQ